MNVNHMSRKIEEIHLLYSARATKQNRTKGLNAGAQAPNALPYYGSDTISVADALKAVKDGFNDVLPLDVLNRLGEKRRITKDTPFLRYSMGVAIKQDANKTTSIMFTML